MYFKYINFYTTELDLDDCPLLKTPPREIREKGFHSTFAYLQRLLSGAVLSKRTKLMLVGLGGAGKTRFADISFIRLTFIIVISVSFCVQNGLMLMSQQWM